MDDLNIPYCFTHTHTHTHTHKAKSDCIRRILKVFTYKKDSNSSKAPKMLGTADVS